MEGLILCINHSSDEKGIFWYTQVNTTADIDLISWVAQVLHYYVFFKLPISMQTLKWPNTVNHLWMPMLAKQLLIFWISYTIN